MLQIREMTGRVALRKALLKEAGLNEKEFTEVQKTLEALAEPTEQTLAVAPIQVPPFGGIVPPSQRRVELASPPVPRFWQGLDFVLPSTHDHIDMFRDKPVIRQLGPDCVGHACRNAAEVQHGVTRERYSGLFAWEYAMQQDGYPVPPRGTWPSVVLKGLSVRGVCLDQLHPEENYRADRYIRPTPDALADARQRTIETSVNLRSLIGDPDLIPLMCLLLVGVPEWDLKGRTLILGVGVPEEWLLRESLLTGVRPVPLSESPVGGHSFVLLGYFHHQGQVWFVGLENWGPEIGSANPFHYPRDMGLVFIPAAFFLDPAWFWDLAITATHAEAALFRTAPTRERLTVLSNHEGRWVSRLRQALVATAASLALLRLLFPGNWWQ